MKTRHIVAGFLGLALIGGVLPGPDNTLHASQAIKGSANREREQEQERDRDRDRRSTCTNATLKGRYATIASAFVPHATPPAPLFPAAHVSLMILDGAGTLSEKTTISDAGVAIRGVHTGTYLVNADCTGQLTIFTPFPPFRLDFDLVLAELEGKEFYAIGTNSPGAVITFTAKRIEQKD